VTTTPAPETAKDGTAAPLFPPVAVAAAESGLQTSTRARTDTAPSSAHKLDALMLDLARRYTYMGTCDAATASGPMGRDIGCGTQPPRFGIIAAAELDLARR